MKNSPKTPSTSAPYVNTPTMNRARLTGPVVGLTLLTLGLVACGGSTPTLSAPSANASGSGAGLNPDIARVPYIYDGKDHSWKDAGTTFSAQALTSGNNDLSAQDWSSANSGWGPVEKNRSNGESGSGDGNTITLQGTSLIGS
ncbi:NPCBM/NEW2 domain-containing protein [Deinococcus sp.]|uniref:NPCBM/NEW2 domain-containing protein n=1 Tax=Deinococcus sp. TaxID=47478 RepID=UPI00286DB24C|nr:NPCBM/NEW2 domain-containing protein [Deinococcus sp.]